VDPSSPDELACGLARVLTDSGVRDALMSRGQAQRKRFSWQKYTLDTVRVLREARDELLN